MREREIDFTLGHVDYIDMWALHGVVELGYRPSETSCYWSWSPMRRVGEPTQASLDCVLVLVYGEGLVYCFIGMIGWVPMVGQSHVSNFIQVYSNVFWLLASPMFCWGHVKVRSLIYLDVACGCEIWGSVVWGIVYWAPMFSNIWWTHVVDLFHRGTL